MNRVIMIGGSAGGMEAVLSIAAALEPDLPAPVLVVQHLSSGIGASIASRLTKASPLHASLAVEGDVLQPGRIYIAPSDHHTLMEEGRVRLTFGPRVNNARPSIDLAFRSAAVAYGAGVVGVIVSGMLDDGAVGLQAVKRCGGTAIVQDPADALYDEMPVSALAAVEADHVLPAARIGERLNQLAHTPVSSSVAIPSEIIMENRFDLNNADDLAEMDQLGNRVPISCPDCGGPLWEIEDGSTSHYRCHIGHSLTAQTLISQQDREVEEALWSALRTLEEKARMQARLVEQSRRTGRGLLETSYAARQQETLEQADRLRSVLNQMGERQRSAAA